MSPRPNFFLALPTPVDPFADSPPPPPPLHRFDVPELHLTLAFLGAVTAEAAMRAFDLAAASVDRSPLVFQPGPVEPFGPRGRFSALSAVPAGDATPLANRMSEVAAIAFPAAGLRPETRPPRPHMTLSRVPRQATEVEREAALDWARTLKPCVPRMQLDRMALYTWAPDRPRRLFVIVREIALRGGAP